MLVEDERRLSLGASSAFCLLVFGGRENPSNGGVHKRGMLALSAIENLHQDIDESFADIRFSASLIGAVAALRRISKASASAAESKRIEFESYTENGNSLSFGLELHPSINCHTTWLGVAPGPSLPATISPPLSLLIRFMSYTRCDFWFRLLATLQNCPTKSRIRTLKALSRWGGTNGQATDRQGFTSEPVPRRL